jgi:hypothetical protein
LTSEIARAREARPQTAAIASQKRHRGATEIDSALRGGHGPQALQAGHPESDSRRACAETVFHGLQT